MQNQFDLLIDSYLTNNVGVDTNFISEDLLIGLRQNIVELQKNDLMLAAGIGNNIIKDEGQNMRGDKIYWMDKKCSNVFEQEFLSRIELLIEYLNRTCYTGINDYEFHYAVYGEGRFYKRHKDQFKNDDDRKFSLIIYLNDHWCEEDGGQLIVYKGNEVQKISPHAKKAVFFKSAELEHEVSMAHRSRMSVTGWLKRV